VISKGYFKVPVDIVNWPVSKAKQFLWEMLTIGGRISNNEYEYWLERLN